MTIEQILGTMGLSVGDPEEVFEIHAKEGAGAFGRVFRATYRTTTREVALKVIPIALKPGQHGEDVENVRKEIEFLRECNHPNIVAFYGAYYKDGALWIAMEYCGGGSVGDISRQRKLCEQEISVIMRGALEGLAHLHSKKKIHRDIKGGNILLTTDGAVKIADFGVSAQLRDTLSRRGTFVGTPYWMSPEMIQDCDYDYKADIWSLGITAIELADQKPPLFEEHPMRVLIQIPRNPAPRLRQPQDWSSHFSHFLQYCLNKSPQDRPSAIDCLTHPFITCWRDIPRVVPGGIQKKAIVDNPPEISQKIATITPVNQVPSQGDQAYTTCTQATCTQGITPGTIKHIAVAETKLKTSQIASVKASESHTFIGTPFEVAHDVCVKFNSQRAQYEGVPSAMTAFHQQFGIPLSNMRCSSKHPNDQVPCLLYMLRRELIARDGVACKHIYRSSPDHSQIQAAKKALEAGTFDAKVHGDPYLIASLLKLWFRELPTPLLAEATLNQFELMAKCINYDEKKFEAHLTCSFNEVHHQVNNFMHTLSTKVRAIFEWLIDHWLEIIDKSKSNLMTAHSLCIVWAPNLINFPSSTPTEATCISKQVALAMQVCIIHSEHIHITRKANEGIASTLVVSPLSSPKSPRRRANKPLPILSKPLFEIRQPLIDILRDCLDKCLDTNDSLDTAFARTQEQMWSLLRTHARTKAEKDYADKLVKLGLPSAMPQSLSDVERFITLTLDFDKFKAAVKREAEIEVSFQKVFSRIITDLI
ncbi:serine/threonine protein kinase [Thraustotheca clavata]|uniref:Serine/threonine protein kinase n=1 Tax=Thraustotheca clavata TaxID=74557 RepID=A0A1V9YT90_9STRA|nr:serine/threonine protein kinase [Thraustotheca clavata]